MGFNQIFKKISSGTNNMFQKIQHGANNMFHKIIPNGAKSVMDTINNAGQFGSTTARKIGNTLEKGGAVVSTIGTAMGNPELINLGRWASVGGAGVKQLGHSINSMAQNASGRVQNVSGDVMNAYNTGRNVGLNPR